MRGCERTNKKSIIHASTCKAFMLAATVRQKIAAEITPSFLYDHLSRIFASVCVLSLRLKEHLIDSFLFLLFVAQTAWFLRLNNGYVQGHARTCVRVNTNVRGIELICCPSNQQLKADSKIN